MIGSLGTTKSQLYRSVAEQQTTHLKQLKNFIHAAGTKLDWLPRNLFHSRKTYLSDESRPIIDDESRPDDIGASVDGSGDERDLEKRRKVVEVGRRGARMDEATLWGKSTVRGVSSCPRGSDCHSS